MDYPNEEILQGDFEREALFVLKKEDGELVGAVSVDDDKVVEELACWSKELQPAAELARLAVKEAYQNQGLARILIQSAQKILQERGCRSVHFLVSKTNERALRSYAKLNFTKKGDADLFGEHWWCYEKALGTAETAL
jgi:ribosomal protein S18 acetylase RimI-like enzyme